MQRLSWKNGTSSARGSRVVWTDICKPKNEGGLGNRHLEEFETVFRLKRVWSYFSEPDSLWARCCNSYWQLQESPRLSPTIRSMLELRSVLTDFMRCVILVMETLQVSGFDAWTSLGPLFEIVGDSCPRSLRVR